MDKKYIGMGIIAVCIVITAALIVPSFMTHTKDIGYYDYELDKSNTLNFMYGVTNYAPSGEVYVIAYVASVRTDDDIFYRKMLDADNFYLSYGGTDYKYNAGKTMTTVEANYTYTNWIQSATGPNTQYLVYEVPYNIDLSKATIKYIDKFQNNVNTADYRPGVFGAFK